LARAYHGPLQLAMLAYHKAATARGDAKQPIHRAKVAIRAPQIVWGDQGQPVAQQRPFLRMTIFT
jgi:hypothetical protein